jgi:hypothetical protein
MNHKLFLILFTLFFTIQFSSAQYEGYTSSRWENQQKVEEQFFELLHLKIILSS